MYLLKFYHFMYKFRVKWKYPFRIFRFLLHSPPPYYHTPPLYRCNIIYVAENVIPKESVHEDACLLHRSHTPTNKSSHQVANCNGLPLFVNFVVSVVVVDIGVVVDVTWLLAQRWPPVPLTSIRIYLLPFCSSSSSSHYICVFFFFVQFSFYIYLYNFIIRIYCCV